MKKNIKILIGSFIILVSLLSILVVSVYAANQPIIKGGLLENLQTDSQKLIKETPTTKQVQLNSENINIEYQYSIQNENQNMDVYIDDKNTEYLLKNDSVVGFIKADKNLTTNMMQNSSKNVLNTNTSLSQGQILDIAINYLAKIVTNFEEYDLMSINYISSYNEYAITYMNKCKGYKTLDTACINITPYGEIVSYYANNQGMMDLYENSNITIAQKEVNSFIEETIANKFNEIKNYEIEDELLTIINEKLAIQYYVKVELNNDLQDSAIVVFYLD